MAQPRFVLLPALLLLLSSSSCCIGARLLQQGSPQAPAPEAAASSAASNATAATAPGSGERFRGDGTAFSESVANTGKGFACSYHYLNDWASTHFAAVNKPQWADGDSCGRCATVRCVDPRCPTQNKDVTVMIVDQCPECKHGDLDFSIPVYREITGSWPNRLTVEWQWSDCSPFIDGTIRLSPKDGINAQWQAFYFSNSRFPLAKVSLNGMELQRSEYQFWQHPAPLGDGPHEFVFESDNGLKLTAACDNPLVEQDLKVQFPRN